MGHQWESLARRNPAQQASEQLVECVGWSCKCTVWMVVAGQSACINPLSEKWQIACVGNATEKRSVSFQSENSNSLKQSNLDSFLKAGRRILLLLIQELFTHVSIGLAA